MNIQSIQAAGDSSSKVTTPVPAGRPAQRDAELSLLVMINNSQESITKQQEVDTQNVMVQTNQELAIYTTANHDLGVLATAVEKPGQDQPTIDQESTAYSVAQTQWQTIESQMQGYVSGATSNGSQDSQNLSNIATLASAATSIQNTTQQLMARFS